MPQQPQMQQPQMGGGMQQPQQQIGGMHQPQQQIGGIQHTGSFGGDTTVGGHTIDDAFAGLSNDPVPSMDEYSTVGAMDGGDSGGMSGGMSTVGGMGVGMGNDNMSTIGGMGSDNMITIGGTSTIDGGMGGGMQHHMQPTVEIATPEASTRPVAQTMQPKSAMPPPPVHQQQQPSHQQQQHAHQAAQQQQQQHQQQASSSASTIPASSNRSSGDSSAELLQLREIHQKLQAEVISLRAKASSVSDEERETQNEIALAAAEIGKLSLELNELKESLMESKVKLTESVGILKIQMERKESLETQVTDARETNEALSSAAEAVADANEVAMAQQAKAVAAAAAAKEEPPLAPVETGDLFSWDAPAPAPTTMNDEGMSAWGSEAPQQPVAVDPSVDSWGGTPNMNNNAASMHIGIEPGGRPSDAASVSGHSVSGHSVHSNQGGGVLPANVGMDARRESLGGYSAGGMSSNPNPYGGFGGFPDPMGGGGAEENLFGMPLGGMKGDGGSTAWRNPEDVPPQPLGGPLGQGDGANNTTAFDHQVAASLAFVQEDTQSIVSSIAPTPKAAVTPAVNHSPPRNQPPSPSKAELESLKSKTTQVEKNFQTKLSLVRSMSTEVTKLESVYKKAEIDMKTMETKKKKGSFGGKKKAKKEYEKALGIANQEKLKVREAKAQLAIAEQEAEKTKREMEESRSKYEQMELEAATAASYLSVQESGSTMSTAMPSESMPMGGSNQYSDPFGSGMIQTAASSASSSGDPYSMGVMGGGGGGGDYENPFTM